VAEFVRVASLGDLKDDLIRVFDVDGTPVAVVQHEGRLYAFEGHCPHSGYSFDWSRIRQGEFVICSSHYSFFELETGKNVDGPATDDLAQYAVRIEGDDVLVHVGLRT
jgi:3-phenylpropionate/trans-cinnamate dioxygenase ferredoxin subunit